MGEYPKRSELAIGDFVEIAMYHQGNKKAKGEIESILTHAETHPHGIMVALTNTKIGRVQRKLPPPAKIPIDLDAAKELHDKIKKDAKMIADFVETDHSNSKEEFIEGLKSYLHENPLPEIKSKQEGVFLEHDIPPEEDDRNEFKESFKADTIYHKLLNGGQKKAAESRKHDCGSKEHVVKKAVSIAASAFANAGGGRLFIGISDDPVEVVGLESDLSAFKNFDEYIRGISDSIKSFTKNQYFTQNIKFQYGEDRKFMVLHVPASASVPVFIYDKDKEEFYTRGHGESCLCQHTDMHRWITERFPDWKP